MTFIDYNHVPKILVLRQVEFTHGLNRGKGDTLTDVDLTLCDCADKTVIGISGNFDEKAALRICRNYFADLKNTGFELSPVSADYSPHTVTVRKNVMQNQIVIGFPAMALGTEHREAGLLISSILGNTPSSRLFQHIREKLGLVYSIETACVSYLKAGVFTVTMGLNEKSEEKAISETLKIISEFGSTVTEKDLARAKEQAVTGFVMELENISARASRSFLWRSDLIS